MKAMVDTNVLLDVMLGRKPFFADSATVFAAIETGRCQGLLCATTVTTIHYIARRHLGPESVLERLTELMSIYDIAPVNRAVLQSSLTQNFTDFEDAVLHEAAVLSGAGCIVTRNIADFRKAQLPVYTPTQFLSALV